MMEDNRRIEEEHRLDITYPSKGDWKDKSLYILSEFKRGTAAEIAGIMADFEKTENIAILEEHIEKTLTLLVEQGEVHGTLNEQVMVYTLPA
jgi:hypothetical protein